MSRMVRSITITVSSFFCNVNHHVKKVGLFFIPFFNLPCSTKCSLEDCCCSAIFSQKCNFLKMRSKFTEGRSEFLTFKVHFAEKGTTNFGLMEAFCHLSYFAQNFLLLSLFSFPH